jgi:hypothetical protein
MLILTTTAFHSPEVHFHGGNADNFPLYNFDLLKLKELKISGIFASILNDFWLKIWAYMFGSSVIPHRIVLCFYDEWPPYFSTN